MLWTDWKRVRQLGSAREPTRLLLRARPSTPAKYDVALATRVTRTIRISEGLQRNTARVQLWNGPRPGADTRALAFLNVTDALWHHDGVLRIVGEDVNTVQREAERGLVEQEVVRQSRHGWTTTKCTLRESNSAVSSHLLLLERQRGSDAPMIRAGARAADNWCGVGRARRAIEVEHTVSL